MKGKRVFLLLVLACMAMTLLLAPGCGGKSDREGEPPATSESTPGGSAQAVEAKRFSLNQWVDVSFPTRTYVSEGGVYKQGPAGTAVCHYLVEGTQVEEELGTLEPQVEGKTYLVVLMKVRGDASNPGGNTHPLRHFETGTDPAPRFVLVDGQGTVYETGVSLHMSATRKLGRKDISDVAFTDAAEYSTAVAFLVLEGASGLRMQVQVYQGKDWKTVGEWTL
ncbi:MAG: hypothetical protein H5T73_09970 [Actinobacteria bacterium]|nr:hypothetical protein [Actinomycetota bacterium]